MIAAISAPIKKPQNPVDETVSALAEKNQAKPIARETKRLNTFISLSLPRRLFRKNLSTPKNDGTFSVYNSVREKLLSKGVPDNEIAFIHNADSEVKKKDLFSKVRSGNVRILLGSTSKMGAGTNVQRLLYASHDLDCPWRPADLEQRAGRIIRQGNTNEKVHIYRYVTKGTFDTYMWQTVEQKQKFISQIFTSKYPVRIADLRFTGQGCKALSEKNCGNHRKNKGT